MDTAAADTTASAVNAVQSLVESTAQMSDKYSMNVVLTIIIVFAFMILVSYVLWTNNQREIRLAVVIDGSIRQMYELVLQHDQRAIDAVRSIGEANTHQREEHKEMIQVLRDINSRVR